MGPWTNPIAATLAALVLTACAPDDATMDSDAMRHSPSVADRMGNTEPTHRRLPKEAFDRAPHSPSGWPLEVGDTITHYRWSELAGTFPGWMENASVSWSNGDDPFGAYYEMVEDYPESGHVGFVYLGHYPVTTARRERDFTRPGWGFFTPPHLRDRGATDHLYNPVARHAHSEGRHVMADSLPVWRGRYHEPWNRRYRNKDGGS